MSFFLPTPATRKMYDALGNFSQAISAVRTKVARAEHQRFLDEGGCKRCRGRGWVVTWDTLDSLSGCYAEFGPCPEACGSGKNTDRPYDRSYRDKYDNNRYEPKTDLDQLATEMGYGSELTSAIADRDRADAEYRAAVEANTVRPGSWVKVVKGRKVAKGTEGRIFWVGEGRWGPRAGFKTSEHADPTWIAVSNLQIAADPFAARG